MGGKQPRELTTPTTAPNAKKKNKPANVTMPKATYKKVYERTFTVQWAPTKLTKEEVDVLESSDELGWAECMDAVKPQKGGWKTVVWKSTDEWESNVKETQQ